ncbi:MAG: GxxExxY protein [Gemmatimonadaceae bacterium]
MRTLAHEMGAVGLAVECGKRIQVRYDRVIVGDFFADMLVDDCVLIENKAVRALIPSHEAQLVNYLTATGVEIGLLLNFGSERLQFKRKTRVYRSRTVRQDDQDRQDGNSAALTSAPIM